MQAPISSMLLTNLLPWTLIYCAIVSPMFTVTEEMLVLAKQAQKLLTEYNVPVAKVADMIREGTREMTKLKTSLVNDHQNKKGDMGDLAKTPLFFVARRHLHKQNVYVVRITYRFEKTPHLKQQYAVMVSGVEVVAEKDYRPVLPM
jgi:hypothetical protein